MRQRLHQVTLIFSLLEASWLGMQADHELGHVGGGSSGRVGDAGVWHRQGPHFGLGLWVDGE